MYLFHILYVTNLPSKPTRAVFALATTLLAYSGCMSIFPCDSPHAYDTPWQTATDKNKKASLATGCSSYTCSETKVQHYHTPFVGGQEAGSINHILARASQEQPWHGENHRYTTTNTLCLEMLRCASKIKHFYPAININHARFSYMALKHWTVTKMYSKSFIAATKTIKKLNIG